MSTKIKVIKETGKGKNIRNGDSTAEEVQTAVGTHNEDITGWGNKVLKAYK